MVRLISGLAYLALATQSINAASLPESSNALNILEAHAGSAPRSEDIVSPDHTLERRKGGGGRGGGGGGGRSSGSSGGSGSRGSSGGAGPPRSFGAGGGFYPGGATQPYGAGRATPRGLLPGALIAPLAIVAIMPGLWLYSVYPYHYNNPYRFYNRTANATNTTNDNDNDRRDLVSLVMRQEMQQGRNETLPVLCLCGENADCGCEENDDPEYINDLVGNGSYAALDKELVTVSDVNGTKTLVLNGTLPLGTTPYGNAAPSLSMGKYTGYWALSMMVVCGVLM